ncbi:MAG: hypothetical protein Q9228_002617, partial [Teloschistes exilis]
MTKFTDLPNELIIHILHLVDRADLEDVAQISRSVYAVAGKELLEHRSLIREEKAPRMWDINPDLICELARGVINDTYRAQYHRNLSLNISFGQHPVMLPQHSSDSPLLDFLGPRTTFERVRQEMVDRGDRITENIDQYSTEVQLAMILLRLPNIFGLVICVEGIGLGDRLRRSRIWETLTQVVAAGTPALVLPKLRAVSLTGFGVRPYHVAVLARIPTVKTIILCSLEPDTAFTADLLPAGPISIETLSVQPPSRPGAIHHNFNANSLHALLAACDHNLTTLSIDRIQIFTAHYPPDMAVHFLTDFAQLLAPVRTSLRRLTLTNITWPREGTTMVKILTSPLTAFENLAYLETHIDEVVFPEECPASIRHLKLHPEKYFWHDRACGCARARRVLEQAARLYGVRGGARVME